MDNEKKSMIKDALILFAITLVAGLLLGFVYDVTKEPIAQQKAKAKAEACKNVFAAAETFEPVMSEDGPTAYFVAGLESKVDIDEVMRALDETGQLLGYVITVTDHEGYGGDIQFSMGVTLDGTLNGISLLSIAETAGLGMKAGDVLVPQFENKQVECFTYTKSGSTNDSEIDAISGATITTNAIVNGVNGGLALFHNVLAGTEGGVTNE
ncbi:MAG: RnfABCDGE type electron transport complex subunit G [Lachnospiraceae bacterium]|nr:RnfABCDGE type electron transport complex subunit G [Lachnospiraceae bacterium]MDE6984794.1 RnfABCDGE type electron transport complex subunit G [Lachnospiraceae bacterium]MDE7028658.1 RnfABCDGE type electron transport complex subunit G [Lachnospiraceae bacterium]